MAIIDDVKELLGIKDNIEDKKLEIMISNVTNRLRNYVDKVTYPEIPTDLNYIIVEIVVKRYNRIGSEGMQSESVDGRSATYQLNDFDEYLDVLSKYNSNENNDTLGSVMFL